MQFPPEGNEYPCAARWCEMLCRPDWPSKSEFPSWLHGPPPIRHMLYDTRAPHPLSTGPSDYSEIFGIFYPSFRVGRVRFGMGGGRGDLPRR